MVSFFKSYHYRSMLKKNPAAVTFYEKCRAVVGDIFSHKNLKFLDTCNFVIKVNKQDRGLRIFIIISFWFFSSSNCINSFQVLRCQDNRFWTLERNETIVNIDWNQCEWCCSMSTVTKTVFQITDALWVCFP